MDAYIVIGHPTAGKSSVVRALTGIRNHERRVMTTAPPNASPFTLWARDSSLQEARIPPATFIAEVGSQGVDAALCTLWPRAVTRGSRPCPDHRGYIAAFQAAGWNVQPLVLLNLGGPGGAALGLPAGVGSQSFTNSHGQPFNRMAAGIRAFWQWE